jgi:hypothetical protein
VPAAHLDDAEIVGRMQTICDEFEAYGYRRVGAELRHQGVIRSEEHTSELQSLVGSSYAVFCLKKKRTGDHPQV